MWIKPEKRLVHVCTLRLNTRLAPTDSQVNERSDGMNWIMGRKSSRG